MLFFYILINLKAVMLGAVYGRLDGGGIAKCKEWIERSLIMFFFVLACSPFAGLWALLAYAGVAGIATGHGQYFLDRKIKSIKPERFDFIVSYLFGRDPRCTPDTNPQIKKRVDKYGLKRLYWRNVFGMFVTGSVVGIPAFLLSICFGQWWGALFLMTGVVKALAYVVGYKVWKSTEPAEYINGGLRNVICLLIISLVV